MQKAIIKPLLASLIIIALAFSVVLVGSSLLGVNAAPVDEACKGVELTGGTCDGAAADASIGTVVKTIVNILSLIVGAVSVIVIIIGGLRYITSGGDAQKTAGAKNTILYAVVGLVVVIFAQIIVAFVISEVTTTPAPAPATP